MQILTAFISTLIVLTSLFMICLILIQRGKGGGLAGAFGGVGGSSAFGTKSGDVFTRVTMIVASVWIVLAMIQVVLYNQAGQSSAWDNDASPTASKEITPKTSKSKAGTGSEKAPSSPSPAPPVSAAPTPKSPVSAPAIPEAPAPK